MMFDYSLAGLVSIGLLFYLTYALLRPSGSDRTRSADLQAAHLKGTSR
jgi:K+-transporting ATPase KdpF subunit